MFKNLFVTGIGTDVGKTVIAAALVRAFDADYWKPVQSGYEDGTDSDFIRSVVSENSKVHSESFILKAPLSPHAAAKLEGKKISLADIELPTTSRKLVIEGAGGLLVPLNDKELVIDLIKKLAVPVVLVSNSYLGSINHTLLSAEALRSRDIPVLGIVFNGETVPESERAILSITGFPCIARIPHYHAISALSISEAASLLSRGLHEPR